MKQGEYEALTILKTIGFSFDENYSDEGKQNMPDLKLSNGEYIEVTHCNYVLVNGMKETIPFNPINKFFPNWKNCIQNYKECKFKEYCIQVKNCKKIILIS